MGTRSTTKVMVDGELIVNMYRQYDGYLAGHGVELFNFLDGMKIVNGMSGNDGPKFANGGGCLAAQLVAHFKKEPGGIYLFGPDQEEGYDYVIEVTEADLWTKPPREGGIIVKVSTDFVGTVEEFGVLVNTPESDE